MSVSLIDDLKTSRRILENIGQPHEFIIATIDKAIEKLTPRTAYDDPYDIIFDDVNYGVIEID